MNHPAARELALYATADLPAVRRLRVRWHISGCPVCQAEVRSFRAAVQQVSRLPGREAESLQDMSMWARLEEEMLANISVGVAAAQCVANAGVSRRRRWRAILFVLGMCILLVIGWITHIPQAETVRLVHTIERSMTVARSESQLTVAGGAGAIGVEGRGSALVVNTPKAAAVEVTGNGQMTATWLDDDSGTVMVAHAQAQ